MKKMIEKVWLFLRNLWQAIVNGIKFLARLVKVAVIALAKFVKNSSVFTYRLGKESGKGALKLIARYGLPVAAGAGACYFFPPLGALIASIAVVSWIGKRIKLTPVASVVVTVLSYICMANLMVIAPIIVFFLAIKAVGDDWHSWGTTVKGWAQKAYDRGVAAAEKAKALPAQSVS